MISKTYLPYFQENNVLFKKVSRNLRVIMKFFVVKSLVPSFIVRATCASLLAMFTAGVAMLSAAMVPGKIEVAKVKGDVKITLSGSNEKQALQAGAVFGPGARITTATGAVADLWFSNGTHVVVQPESDLRIAKFSITESAKVPKSGFNKLSAEPSYSSSLLELQSGTLFLEVQKLRTPISDFKVRLPFYTADVKGTVFLAEQAEKYARLGTVEGVVAVVPRLNLGAPTEVTTGRVVVYRLREGKDPINEQRDLTLTERRQVEGALGDSGSSLPTQPGGETPTPPTVPGSSGPAEEIDNTLHLPPTVPISPLPE
jgi:hypothetical protein